MTADKKLDMLQAATGVLFILFLLGQLTVPSLHWGERR
jgi:hypothetical protein